MRIFTGFSASSSLSKIRVRLLPVLPLFLLIFALTGNVKSQPYSCFTNGYISYHTCGSTLSFSGVSGGGLSSPPQGSAGAPNYGGCWKNGNAGDRANWIVIQPTAAGQWTFNFSPNTGNVNAWIWGPFTTVPSSCANLQSLLDCNNGSGGNPISVTAPVLAGKYYVTLVTNPTGTNSIITITTSSGEATVASPIANNGSRCGPGTVLLSASGAIIDEKYEWWSASVGGVRLKRSINHLDSTYTTASISNTTTYYVSKLFLLPAPYTDSCAGSRVPVVATINPLAVAPVSVSTNLTNVCSPDPRNIVLTSTGGSGVIQKWFNFSCGTSQVGTGTVLTLPAPTVTTTYYTAWAETICGLSACANITITVNAPVTSGSTGPDQTVCSGGDPVPITSIANGTGSGVINYRWERFSGAGPWTVLPGATTSSYDPPSGFVQNSQFRRTTISTQAGGTCESAPTTPVNVYANAITAGTQETNQQICFGDDPKTFIDLIPATGSGILTYQWENFTQPLGPWQIVAGATSNVYTAPAGLSQTTSYRRISTSNLNGVKCNAISPSLTIIVNAIPVTSGIYHNQ